MITVRKADARGYADHGWLKARHSFSFAGYRDPAFMGFRTLRVLNEDRVAPGAGFPEHPHRDMEIITVVLEGSLAHRDNSGGHGIIRPGMIQRMSAGSGVLHSEFNASKTEPVHLMQIWIVPDRTGVPPRYEDRTIPDSDRHNRLALLVSPDGADGSLHIYQDVRLYGSRLDAWSEVTHPLAKGRHAWLQVASGDVTVNGVALDTGDAAAISDEGTLDIVATSDAEILLFDLN
jgi:redox-sensitive bicupin YhaK (pirin superfamily)